MKVSIESNRRKINWTNGIVHVAKKYSDAVIDFELLPNNSGIILLEPVDETGPENAVIYNIDGSERWRLPFPKNLGSGFLFDRVGMSGSELIVIGIFDGRDVKFVVDYEKLQYKEISSAR